MSILNRILQMVHLRDTPERWVARVAPIHQYIVQEAKRRFGTYPERDAWKCAQWSRVEAALGRRPLE